MEARKKMALASALILLWAGLAAWQWSFREEPLRVPLTNITGLPASGGQVADTGTTWRVNLGLLTSADVQREARFEAPRNIFAIPRSDGSLPLDEDTVLADRQDPALEETAVEQGEEEEATLYRYLGYLHVGESRQKRKDLAVLRKDDEVMLLRVGDRVDDHVVLQTITAESVTIRDTDTRMEKTVPLSDETVEQE